MAIALWYFLVFQTLMFQVSNALFDKSKVTFYLYRRGLENNPIQLTLENLQQAPFNRDLETVMFIHGYLGGYDKPIPQEIKDAFLSVRDTNVILVDNSRYSLSYLVLVANVDNVGKTCANLINALLDQRIVDIANITLVGHSAGAHIAGATANNVNGDIEVIAGLDPAGPYFRDQPPENRLSADDAKFVQCIHTSKTLGIGKAIGDVDFFPNAGSDQPVCATDENEVLFGTCSHLVAPDYYAAAVKVPTMYPASFCQWKEDAKSLKTAPRCIPAMNVYMGSVLPMRPPPGSYFVNVTM